MTAAKTSAGGRLAGLFAGAGATWLDLPVLHPVDPFLETAGEDIRRRVFVTEGASGERFCLRPDFTIPVCRHHMATGSGPGRYAYEGLVFRRQAAGAPERLETGFEAIGGTNEAEDDASALALAAEGVSALGADALEIRIGDIGLFAALLKALDLPDAWRRRLRRSFGVPVRMQANLARLAQPNGGETATVDAEFAEAARAGDVAVLEVLIAETLAAHGHTPGAGRTAAEIAGRYIDQRALSETHLEKPTLQVLQDYLDLDAPLAEAGDRLTAFADAAGLDLAAPLALFAARASAIADRMPTDNIRFAGDFGRPLDYYTGLVFQITAAGSDNPVAGGGRYDRLMEMLGAPAPVPA
ncbi:MAG TPA: ATP phosphoribosyltransferase regulatory subunit, partial [Afifellaceae bacterium]|nr:ATP phosphoribosyltransferase regulatory subunit [Afifellaceae bacterium]